MKSEIILVNKYDFPTMSEAYPRLYLRNLHKYLKTNSSLHEIPHIFSRHTGLPTKFTRAPRTNRYKDKMTRDGINLFDEIQHFITRMINSYNEIISQSSNQLGCIHNCFFEEHVHIKAIHIYRNRQNAKIARIYTKAN